MTALTPPAVVTIDAGSGSCRALVFDAAGALRGIAQREWTYHPAPAAPGGYDFDTADGWRQVCACVREALATARTDAGYAARQERLNVNGGRLTIDRHAI